MKTCAEGISNLLVGVIEQAFADYRDDVNFVNEMCDIKALVKKAVTEHKKKLKIRENARKRAEEKGVKECPNRRKGYVTLEETRNNLLRKIDDAIRDVESIERWVLSEKNMFLLDVNRDEVVRELRTKYPMNKYIKVQFKYY